MVKSKKTKEKIYEYNPDSKVIRWRYVNEDPQNLDGQIMVD
jgi:hypothetical protein